MVSVEYSGQVIAHLFKKATLVVAIVRWVICWTFRHMGLGLCLTNFSSINTDPPQSSSTLAASAQEIRDSLPIATYEEIKERLPETGGTCAVCLSDLSGHDEVWDLRNCCHVFHKRCLDRWLDHDEHKTCPLCRAPLLGHDLGHLQAEPSWVVERLLYLFGDDLLMGQ